MKNRWTKLALFVIFSISFTFIELNFFSQSLYNRTGIFFALIVLINGIFFLGLLKISSLVWQLFPQKKIKTSTTQKNDMLDVLKAPVYSQSIHVLETVTTKNGIFEGYIVEIYGVYLFIKSVLDIQLIDNIFLRKQYNSSITPSSVVIDIGANIGFSALWFAKNPNVNKVYAFEPVSPVYEQALKSTMLNNNLKEKIEFRNVGLADKNYSTSIIFMPEHHTVSSLLITDEQQIFRYKKSSLSINIELVNASKILEQIINENNSEETNFILKIDCEGSEYKIIETFNAKIWNSINSIFMEIHGESYQEIVDHLINKNFHVFSINHQSHPVFHHLCDIYAVKI
jgi:FkbM family methyltransferase